MSTSLDFLKMDNISSLARRVSLIAGIIKKKNNFSLAMIIVRLVLFSEHLTILKDLFMMANWFYGLKKQFFNYFMNICLKIKKNSHIHKYLKMKITLLKIWLKYLGHWIFFSLKYSKIWNHKINKKRNLNIFHIWKTILLCLFNTIYFIIFQNWAKNNVFQNYCH